MKLVDDLADASPASASYPVGKGMFVLKLLGFCEVDASDSSVML